MSHGDNSKSISWLKVPIPKTITFEGPGNDRENIFSRNYRERQRDIKPVYTMTEKCTVIFVPV